MTSLSPVGSKTWSRDNHKHCHGEQKSDNNSRGGEGRGGEGRGGEIEDSTRLDSPGASKYRKASSPDHTAGRCRRTTSPSSTSCPGRARLSLLLCPPPPPPPPPRPEPGDRSSVGRPLA